MYLLLFIPISYQETSSFNAKRRIKLYYLNFGVTELNYHSTPEFLKKCGFYSLFSLLFRYQKIFDTRMCISG